MLLLIHAKLVNTHLGVLLTKTLPVLEFRKDSGTTVLTGGPVWNSGAI